METEQTSMAALPESAQEFVMRWSSIVRDTLVIGNHIPTLARMSQAAKELVRFATVVTDIECYKTVSLLCGMYHEWIGKVDIKGMCGYSSEPIKLMPLPIAYIVGRDYEGDMNPQRRAFCITAPNSIPDFRIRIVMEHFADDLPSLVKSMLSGWKRNTEYLSDMPSIQRPWLEEMEDTSNYSIVVKKVQDPHLCGTLVSSLLCCLTPKLGECGFVLWDKIRVENGKRDMYKMICYKLWGDIKDKVEGLLEIEETDSVVEPIDESQESLPFM